MLRIRPLLPSLAALLAIACSDVDRTRWAARFGDRDAQLELGERLATGDGVERDFDEALEWLERAAEDGSRPAQKRLIELYGERGSDSDEARAEHWLRVAADAGDADAQYALAKRLAKRGGVPDEVRALRARAAEAGHGEAAFELAKAIVGQPEAERDLVALERWVRVAAEAEVADGQRLLGEMYALGLGVDADPGQARAWFERAAEQGDLQAQLSLGLLYQSGQGVAPSPTEAKKWFERAAEQGSPEAQNQLGVLYAQGRLADEATKEQVAFLTSGGAGSSTDVDERLKELGEEAQRNNDRRAVEWYRRAIAQNHAPAMSNLAALLRAGRGAPDADPEEVEQEVRRLFERAAAQGDAIAQAELAEHYASGDAQDSEKSLENLLASARGGYAPAQYAVAALYLEGKGVEKDPGEALRWFREAAQAGMPAAEIALGTLLASGAEGIAQDDAAARVWFEKAAARGEADAEWSLGVMHEEGRGGLAPSATRAVEWWMRAAKQGHPLARAKLGVAYVSGEGVRRDLVEAYAWLAASGVPEAQNWVDQLADRLGARDLARAEKLAGERRVQPAADAASDRTAD